MSRRIALLLFLATEAVSALKPAPDGASCDPIGPRKDCGYLGITKKACEAKGCCWLPLVDLEDSIRGGPQLEQPACFHPNTATTIYQATDVNQTRTHTEAYLKLKQATQPELGLDSERLRLEVETSVPDLLHVKITDARRRRWEVPQSLLHTSAEHIKGTPSHAAVAQDIGVAEEPHKYVYKQSEQPFSFEIIRSGAGPGERPEPIWNTTGRRLIFKEQYLEITSSAPASSIMYGLGERISSSGLQLRRNGKPMTLWNRDCTDYPDLNLYGSHPFLMEVRPDGTAHGVLLWNSNGMDAVVTDDYVSFRVTGGILDMYFFLGPTPMEVLEQYTRLFGRPALPPIWALGFHQSKYGYSSIGEMQEVVDNYTKANIPLDVMWGDIDYMERWRDFTFDPVNFPLAALQEFVEKLHNGSRRFVPILDPGIPVLPGYKPYEDGIKQDIFIRDVTGQPYIGEVWPGAVHFPDFLDPKGQKWWLDMVKEFHEKVPFDGLWVDMNEASNFCTGHVCEMPPEGLLDFVDKRVGKPFFEFGTEPPACQLQCWSLEPYLKQWLLQEEATRNMPSDHATGAFLGSLVKGVATSPGARPWQETDLQQHTWDQFLKVDAPPYSIANNNVRLPLSFRAIPVTARHHDGALQYDTHNLYGLSHAAATFRALDTIYAGKRRPFVLTRSTFVGSGGWAAHWTGDNAATWDDLHWSVTGILDAGLLAMPMVGADICGFLGITTEELCARWISAGAFYPFPRDHSDLTSGYQELYLWPKVAEAARYALGIRYSLLPYLYTSFRSTASHGCPLARPLMLGWPGDPAARTSDRQWTMGDAVLITPVLDQGRDSVQGYFPAGTWYSLMGGPTVDASEAGRPVTLKAPLGEVPVHILGGAIIPMQEPRLTTAETMKTPLSLVVAFPKHAEDGYSSKVLRCGYKPPGATALTGSASGTWVAWGQLYIDNGEETDLALGGVFVNFRAEVQPSGNGMLTGTFSSTGEWHGADMANSAKGLPWPVLDRVRMLGLPGSIDESSITFEIMTPGKIHPLRTIPVKPSKVKQTIAETNEVIVEGLGHRLECPEGIRLSWKLRQSSKHGEEL